MSLQIYLYILTTICLDPLSPQPGIGISSNCTDSCMASMKSRQNNQEERLEKFYGIILSLNIAMQGAESMYKIVQESI